MSVLKRDCGLVDIYRQKNKKERQFTWEGGSGHNKVQCRLYRFYVQKTIFNTVSSFSHIPVLNSISDHCLVCFHIDTSSLCESLGPGFWKCNV